MENKKWLKIRVKLLINSDFSNNQTLRVFELDKFELWITDFTSFKKEFNNIVEKKREVFEILTKEQIKIMKNEELKTYLIFDVIEIDQDYIVENDLLEKIETYLYVFTFEKEKGVE